MSKPRHYSEPFKRQGKEQVPFKCPLCNYALDANGPELQPNVKNEPAHILCKRGVMRSGHIKILCPKQKFGDKK